MEYNELTEQLFQDIVRGCIQGKDVLCERLRAIYKDICGEVCLEEFEAHILSAASEVYGDGKDALLGMAQEVITIIQIGSHMEKECIVDYFEITGKKMLRKRSQKIIWKEYKEFKEKYEKRRKKPLTRSVLSRNNPELAQKMKDAGLWEAVPKRNTTEADAMMRIFLERYCEHLDD